MAKSTWPEDNYADDVVLYVREGESDQSALERAKLCYSEGTEYYITTAPSLPGEQIWNEETF